MPKISLISETSYESGATRKARHYTRQCWQVNLVISNYCFHGKVTS